ncbi:MAG: glycine--tRNA ligase subunit beta [Fimbriimonadaceae bacterium]|nr:glycine--tRNA ligase subunit beta [Fimbriimonadaceae bacterium]
MPDLLLELGVEELPATFVKKAYTDLAQNIETRLTEANIPFTQGNPPIGTPRRLIVHFSDVADRQPDQVKEQRGPALAAAFDADGNPSKAMEGFCRGQGVDPGQAEKRDGYVWVTKTIPGRPTLEVLSEVLPASIRGLNFDKSMRWGASKMRFARPIRWILASFGGSVVPFDVEGVQAGLESRGHRFYSPDAFGAKSYEELVNGLLSRKVEPDPAEREKTIREVATISASGTAEMPDALVAENVFLTEWPTPIEGSFKTSYMDLPVSVLVTAMAKHEKMFPIRDSNGKLTNKFIFIRNSGEDETVRAGTEWVLNARFNDAKFFFDEDKKHSISAFLDKCEGIVFQEKLGSVRQRADRLAKLASLVAQESGGPEEEIEFAATAGLYAKADLSTGLVSELASLQGVVGGEYMRREGFPDAACHAVASHYDLGKNPNPPNCAGSRTAVRLQMADQLDKLAGYLGLGLIPTSSSDPFGLRRAVTLLIEAAWMMPGMTSDYQDLLTKASEIYRGQGHELDLSKTLTAAKELFVARYVNLFPDAEKDHLDAAIQADDPSRAFNPEAVKFGLECVKLIADDIPLIQTATRPINIVSAAEQKGIGFEKLAPLQSLDRTALDSAEGLSLALALDEANAADKSTPGKMVAALRKLQGPINAFFDSTMVMVEDEKVRTARLTLLQAARIQLLQACDFTKIVVEG